MKLAFPIRFVLYAYSYWFRQDATVSTQPTHSGRESVSFHLSLSLYLLPLCITPYLSGVFILQIAYNNKYSHTQSIPVNHTQQTIFGLCQCNALCIADWISKQKKKETTMRCFNCVDKKTIDVTVNKSLEW